MTGGLNTESRLLLGAHSSATRASVSSSIPLHSGCDTGPQALDVGWITMKTNRDALLGQNTEQEGCSGVYREAVSAEPRYCSECGLGGEMKTEAEGGGDSAGPRQKAADTMAASTSDFWQEVLKIPS